MNSPFQFGTLASGENFIDRQHERAELKQMLSSGISVALVSPRRWGKSSLVAMAMEELCTEQSNVRVCFIDCFSINSETEFYSMFASAVISCATGKIEKALKDAKKYLGGLIPGLTIGDGTNDLLSINLHYTPKEMDKMEILQLPETIAKDKKIRIIVCIDEFQQLAQLPEYADMEGKMRSVWQRQQSVSYCFYGSKKHMMLDIFGNSQKPFYRFANVVFLQKIPKSDWIPFIEESFNKTGKSISMEIVEQICEVTECHSWYLQQLCFLVWSATDKFVTDEILSQSIQRLMDMNAPMFISDLEKLTPSQREMLRAIANNEKRLSSVDTKSRYNLGNPNTINRNKQVLMDKSFIESANGELYISDPIFKLWQKQQSNW